MASDDASTPAAPGAPDDVEQAKTLLYGGPLESFVAERGAMVKALRAAGRKDEATAVKALRKPSRPAWTLDAGFFADPDVVEGLAAAVNEVIDAQSGRGDMRDATRSLRDAVQAVTAVAATTAKEAGVNVERASLGPALLAVVADPVAFAELRHGHLTEIPAAGALDVLTNPPPLLPVSPAATTALRERAAAAAASSAAASSGSGSGSAEEAREPVDLAARRRAREAVKEAEADATAARREAEAADRAVDDARAALESAEDRLRDAEADVKAARSDLHDAQQTAKSTRASARQADRDLATTRKSHPTD